MDQVMKKLFLRILLTHQKSSRRLGGCYCLSSKTVLSNMPLLLKWGDKEDCIPEKNDPFRLLLDSNLIHKKPILKCLTVTLPKDPLLSDKKQLSKNSHNEEFIEWIEKQSNFDIKSEKFKTLTSDLSANLHLLNGEQLIKIINHLGFIGEKSKHIEGLVAKLDQECCNYPRKWDKNTYFSIAWSFFQLKSYSALHLQKKMLVDLAGLIKQMSSQELVMYLVILKQFRRFPRNINKADIEIRLSEVLDNLSVEDLGLVCLAFFECNEAVQNTELVGRLVERLLANSTSADEKTVGSMLKLFRRSSTDTGNFAKQVLDIQPRLCDLVHRWNPKVLIQLIAVGSNLLFFHDATIEQVAQKFLTCMSKARLKDVERLALAIAIACHQSPSGNGFWEVLENEFTTTERRHEINRYPNAFISLVSYAIIANRYPEQLLQIALNPDFVGIAKTFADQSSYNSTKRELLLINCSLNIERPGYDGPKLSTNDAQAFEKLYRKPIPSVDNRKNLTNHDRFLFLLLDSVREILGENTSASLVYLQPHFVTPDIIFEIDSRGGKSASLSYGDCKLKRCALIGASRNMFSKFGDQPMGPLRMKIRQIRAMGYHVIVIPWFEFLNRTQNDRLALLSHKIRLTINDRKS